LAVLDREAAAAEGPKQAVIPHLKQLINRTLAKDPQTRPSAAEFVAETALLLSEIGRPLPTREHWLMRLEQDNPLLFAHRRRLGIVATLIVAIALLLGIGSALRGVILPMRTVASSPVSTNTRPVTSAPTLAVATPPMTQPAPTRVLLRPPQFSPHPRACR